MARGAVAHKRQVEDLPRQIGEVEGAWQAADFGHPQARILGPLARDEPDHDARLLEETRKQIGVLPIEVDQNDSTPGAFRDGRGE